MTSPKTITPRPSTSKLESPFSGGIAPCLVASEQFNKEVTSSKAPDNLENLPKKRERKDAQLLRGLVPLENLYKSWRCSTRCHCPKASAQTLLVCWRVGNKKTTLKLLASSTLGVLLGKWMALDCETTRSNRNPQLFKHAYANLAASSQQGMRE